MQTDVVVTAFLRNQSFRGEDKVKDTNNAARSPDGSGPTRDEIIPVKDPGTPPIAADISASSSSNKLGCKQVFLRKTSSGSWIRLESLGLAQKKVVNGFEVRLDLSNCLGTYRYCEGALMVN